MIAFFSNFINEHQIPFCNSMYEKTAGEFRFIATEKFMDERLKMGFRDRSDTIPYLIKSYESDSSFSEAMKIGYESDAVIIGSAPDVFIKKRLEDNRLTFRYYERYFKNGRWRILDPRVLRARYNADFRYRNKNLYMLCASAYTAPDCRFILSYPKKTYRWGYFPEVKKHDAKKLIESKKEFSILWAGRQIWWKHPEDAVYLAEKLKLGGYKFRLTIIGQGEKEKEIVSMIEKKNLSGFVSVKGFMPPEEVRKQMEESDIYIFTSDRNEGWGAVLNESMNSACAVVANREIGSAPYLIKDGENGLIYNRRDKADLFKKVKSLLDNKELKHKIQLGAYSTMINLWNADVAAGRLLNLIDCIKSGKSTDYEDGPCSEDF